jgi:hypothetical protein
LAQPNSCHAADKIHHIPREASLGGAETMYPAFRDKIKDKFTIPPKCMRNCDAPPVGPN